MRRVLRTSTIPIVKLYNTKAVLQVRVMRKSVSIVFEEQNIRHFYWFTESLPYQFRDTVRALQEIYTQ
jgi:hypothetical protein